MSTLPENPMKSALLRQDLENVRQLMLALHMAVSDNRPIALLAEIIVGKLEAILDQLAEKGAA